jgi:hypothetical protein
MRHPEVSEKQLRATILQAASLCRWHAYFTWNSLHSPAGYPDLTLVRGNRLIFAELKSPTGRVTPAQQDWLTALEAVQAPPLVDVWRPADLDRVLDLLKTY